MLAGLYLLSKLAFNGFLICTHNAIAYSYSHNTNTNMNFQTFDQQQQQYIQHIQQKFVEFCVCANSKSVLSQTPTRALPEMSFYLVLLHFHRAYIEYFKIRRSFLCSWLCRSVYISRPLLKWKRALVSFMNIHIFIMVCEKSTWMWLFNANILLLLLLFTALSYLNAVGLSKYRRRLN